MRLSIDKKIKISLSKNASNTSSKIIFSIFMRIPYSICVDHALNFTSQNCLLFFESSNTKEICCAVDDHRSNGLFKNLVRLVKIKLTCNDQ